MLEFCINLFSLKLKWICFLLLLLIMIFFLSGNIVLHMFLEEVRAKYDIESCQLFDSKFDTCGNMELDPMLHIIEEQMEFFNSLQQSNTTEVPKDIS